MIKKSLQPVIYTALLGDYDDLKNHTYPKESSFCFTDRMNLVSDSWTIIPIKRRTTSIDERIRLARFIKTHAHSLLPEHTTSIWIDASMQINGDCNRLIQYVEFTDIATFKYPGIWGARECAYEEAIACIRRGKDAEDVIIRQMDRYRKYQYPVNNGLVETSILVRKNSSKVMSFNKKWWQEISNGSRRDQLSFNFCCWRLNLEYAFIPGHRLQNPFSNYIAHKEMIYSGHSYISTEI